MVDLLILGFLQYLLFFAPWFGATLSLFTVVLADMVGTGKMSKAWGLNLCMQGFSVMFSPVIIGWLADTTNSFKSGFNYIAIGALCAAAFYTLAWKWDRLAPFLSARCKCK